MGRLRARLAKAHEDRIFMGYVADAERSLNQALAVCGKVARTQDAARAKQNISVIRKALAMLHSTRMMSGLSEMGDPDLLPESQRIEISRQRNAERRAMKGHNEE